MNWGMRQRGIHLNVSKQKLIGPCGVQLVEERCTLQTGARKIEIFVGEIVILKCIMTSWIIIVGILADEYEFCDFERSVGLFRESELKLD